GQRQPPGDLPPTGRVGNRDRHPEKNGLQVACPRQRRRLWANGPAAARRFSADGRGTIPAQLGGMPTRRVPRAARGSTATARLLAPLLLLACGASLRAQTQAVASPTFIEAQRAEAHGEYARAQELYGEAYKSDPANTRALFGRARMRSWQGNFDAAIADYREGLQRDPQNAEALSGLGWTYAWSHRFDDAVSVFQTLARLQPYDLDPKKGLAYVALWRGHPNDARRQFEA